MLMNIVQAAKNRGMSRGGGACFCPLWLGKLLAFAVLALVLGGCGIQESTSYLQPPGFSDAGGMLTLSDVSANDSDSSFLGYDIYYRAYYYNSSAADSPDADTALNAIDAAIGSSTSTPDSVLSLMTSTYSFRKMYLAATPSVTPTPLLPKNVSTYYIYYPNTSSTKDWYYTTTASTTQINLIRNNGNTNASENSFNYTYTISDPDYGSTTNGVTSGGYVAIVAFAVAYGYDFSTLTTKTSFPASLYLPVNKNYGIKLP
jgi:hypothetical protein